MLDPLDHKRPWDFCHYIITCVAIIAAMSCIVSASGIGFQVLLARYAGYMDSDQQTQAGNAE